MPHTSYLLCLNVERHSAAVPRSEPNLHEGEKAVLAIKVDMETSTCSLPLLCLAPIRQRSERKEGQEAYRECIAL